MNRKLISVLLSLSLSIPVNAYAATLLVPQGGTGSTTLTGLLKGNGKSSIRTAVPGTDYISSVTGDWTGTFDGLEGTVYLSSSFSTTSADYWKTARSFFATTTEDYWLTQRQGAAFSTTSAAYFLSLYQAAAFSTTSADYWKTQRDFYSTTSADAWLALRRGAAFSTTSADYWGSTKGYLTAAAGDSFTHPSSGVSATTSGLIVSASSTIGRGGDGGGLAINGGATTTGSFIVASSTSIFPMLRVWPTGEVDTTHVTLDDGAGNMLADGTLTLAPLANCSNGLYADSNGQILCNAMLFGAFSTTTNDYWLSQRQGAAFSTTSANYLESTFARWATTSTDYWLTVRQGAAFSTTSADYWKTQQTFTAASTTLLGDNNTFSGLNSFTTTGTTTFAGGIDFTRFNLSATSTGSRGIDLSGGCFAINHVCLSGGGSTSPGGSDTQLQFNNAGSFGGAKLEYSVISGTAISLKTEDQTTTDTDGVETRFFGSNGNGGFNGGAFIFQGGNSGNWDGGDQGVAGSVGAGGGYLKVSAGIYSATGNAADGGGLTYVAGSAYNDGSVSNADGGPIHLEAGYGDRSGGDFAIIPGAGGTTNGKLLLYKPGTNSYVDLDLSAISASRSVAFADKAGTIALLDSSGLGAASFDDITFPVGAISVSGSDLVVTGSDTDLLLAADGNVVVTAPLHLKNAGSGFSAIFDTSALAADRTFTPPDQSGTLCIVGVLCDGTGGSFSTTTNDYWLSQRQGASYSTTSADYWLSLRQGAAFSTTSADYWKTQQTFTGASTTLLANNNTWSGNNLFNASTTFAAQLNMQTASSSALTSTFGYFTTASTTNLNISGIRGGLLGTNMAGVVSATTSIGANLLTGNLTTINNTLIAANTSNTITAASSTLLANNNTFSGNNIFTASTTFNTIINFQYGSSTAITATFGYFSTASTSNLNVSGIRGGILGTNMNGVVSASTSIGANLLSGQLTNSQLQNSTISGISLGSNLNSLSVSGSITGTSYNGSASVSDWALNMANANTWTAKQTFANASSSDFSTSNSFFLTQLTGYAPLALDQNKKVSTYATSTAYGSGTPGQVLMWSGITGAPVWAATSSSAGSVSGGTNGMLTAWSGASTLTATSGPTFAFFFGTSTATSTLTGGLNVAALNETGNSTSTFVNGINLSNGCFSIAGTCITGGGGPGATPGGSDAQLQFNDGGSTFGGASLLTYYKNSLKFGIGTTTPWGMLSLASSTPDYTTPLLTVATSTNPWGFLLGIWATTTGMVSANNPFGRVTDSGTRVAIGTTQTYDHPALMDQLTLNGRFNTLDWRSSVCSGVLNAAADSLNADAANACGDFTFEEDASGNAFRDVTGSIPFIHLCNSASGSASSCTGSVSANDGTGLFYPAAANSVAPFDGFGTSTPSMETVARITKPLQATTSSFYIGFTNLSSTQTTFETEPTIGCYFVASSTIASGNWLAIARKTAALNTRVDTGFASSTSVSNTGSFYRFRIDADANGCRFYMASTTQPLTMVANISTNAPTTPNASFKMAAGIYTANIGQPLANVGLDVASAKVWFYQPALNY